MSLGRWQSAIDKALQDLFDNEDLRNLPGTGKPLNLSKDGNIPSDMRMAYKIMQENDVAPDWIMLRKELEQNEAKLRDRIQRTARNYLSALAGADRVTKDQAAAFRQNAEAQWTSAQKAIDVAVQQHNDRVLTYNLKIPTGVSPRRRFDFLREVDKALRG